MADILEENCTCPACHSQAKRLFGETREVFGQTWKLARCANCETAFTSPNPDDETLQEVYRTCFNYNWYRDHYPAKRRDAQERLREYGPLLGQRILDFGGGVGYFSEAARDAGYQSTTYDPFTAAAEPSPTSWDTVVALHVIEHANDLDRICVQMKKLLASDGRLILAVPNFAGHGYRKLGMQWVWAQPPLIHIYHFTARGLTALMQRHGFTDIQISYHERWDANTYCDVEHARWYSFLGKLWSMPLLCRWSAYRRMIATMNTNLRFRGLRRSLKNQPTNVAEFAELQITAVLPRS